MPNPFVHVELNTPYPEKAKAFYSKLFDWRLDDVENPESPDDIYTMIIVGNGTGGGIMRQVPGGPVGWIPYVEVNDINAYTEKAKTFGGKVMKPATEVLGMGWLSIIQDPAGTIVGMWQKKPR